MFVMKEFEVLEVPAIVRIKKIKISELFQA